MDLSSHIVPMYHWLTLNWTVKQIKTSVPFFTSAYQNDGLLLSLLSRLRLTLQLTISVTFMEILTNPRASCPSYLNQLKMTQIKFLINRPLTTFWFILRSCCPTSISFRMSRFFADHLTLLVGLWVSTTRIQYWTLVYDVEFPDRELK